MAWPDFDRRATITTVPALESFLDGIGLVESSSWNVKGKSFFVARTIDTVLVLTDVDTQREYRFDCSIGQCEYVLQELQAQTAES